MAELGLSVTEAAKLIGISRDLAYDMVAEGVIPHIRFRGRIVVPRKALEKLMASGGVSA